MNVCASMCLHVDFWSSLVSLHQRGVACANLGVAFPQFNDEKRLMGYHQHLQNIIEDQVCSLIPRPPFPTQYCFHYLCVIYTRELKITAAWPFLAFEFLRGETPRHTDIGRESPAPPYTKCVLPSHRLLLAVMYTNYHLSSSYALSCLMTTMYKDTEQLTLTGSSSLVCSQRGSL